VVNRQTLLAGTAVALLMCGAPALAQVQQKGGEEKASPPRPSGSAAGEQHTQQRQQEQQGARGQGSGAAATHGREPAGRSAQGSSRTRGETQSQSQQKGAEAEKGEPQSRRKGAQLPPEQKGGQSQLRPEQRGGQSRTQQKGAESEPQPKSGRKGAEVPSRQHGAGTEQRGGNGAAGTERSGETSKSAQRGGRVELSQQQRTSVHQTLLRERDVNRLGRVDFTINVGTRVPRALRLAVLPAAVITLVPQYRDFRYFVADDEICIVDPGSFEIVEVIGGPSQTARSGHGVTHQGLALTREEREIVMRNVELDAGSTLGLGSLSEGAPVPRDVRLRAFPARVERDVPKLQGYRYFAAENRVAIVDPQDNRVALVIHE
jgi:hypothetical protein